MKTKRVEFRTYPEWVHHELTNWARWCWAGPYPHPMPPTSCYSIEKNYQRISEDGEASSEKPVTPNSANAEIVQAVWDTLPDLPQQVLRAEYPQRFESGRVEGGRSAAARWLGVSIEAYEAALSVACYKVLVAFERGA